MMASMVAVSAKNGPAESGKLRCGTRKAHIDGGDLIDDRIVSHRRSVRSFRSLTLATLIRPEIVAAMVAVAEQHVPGSAAAPRRPHGSGEHGGLGLALSRW